MKPLVVLGVVVAAVSVFALLGRPKVEAPESQSAEQQTKTVMNFDQTSPKRSDKLVLSEDEWKARLTPEQYQILRGKGTERPFCGINLEDKGAGAYHCVGCDLPLFKAGRKFNSGTGWPSYTEPAADDAVWYKKDTGYGMVRTEVLCARCDGHLGHVFDDGPPPTGLRYCINGTVLKFVKDSDSR
ncbi:MAG: peptide-methionine (R)-S-oxide reductase MsrB [Fimbriimonadaceae bacterium]|nr:peptide-methionine (R)-S-oxide reductase MsrB [Fimbriimonadaceae bacterium]QYK57720.1 MAG: peptide-methionine (R)-S-oxide reductase MsrB [Fimbriimonadaceae bacterium]